MPDEKREELISPIAALSRQLQRITHLNPIPRIDSDFHKRVMGWRKPSEWDATAWWDGPDAIEHAEAVAMLDLSNKTAKEKSKIMASIREIAGDALRSKKLGNRHVYHRNDWKNVAAGVRALTRRNGDDSDGTTPSPDDIERLKRSMRPRK